MRLKIFGIAFVCLLLFVSCGTKLNTAKASAIIREAFELTKEDKLEILEIFMESENIASVKFEIYEFQVASKLKRFVDKGWQIYEVQLPDDLSPWDPEKDLIAWLKEFIKQEKEDRKQEKKDRERAEKEKMERKKFPKRTVLRNIETIAGAISDSIVDYGVAPKQDGIYDENSKFYFRFSPFYVKKLPVKDPWENNYLVYTGTACNGKYGITGCGSKDYVVVSYGQDGEKEDWEFDATNPEAGLFVIKSKKDLNKDFIMFNSSWIRCPKDKKD